MMTFAARQWRCFTLAGLSILLLLTFACRQADSVAAGAPAAATAALPRLVDLGADKCVPCKMMAPILDELKRDYAGRFEVQFIDVWKHEEEAAHYGVRMIPTQIFCDAAGKELYRRSGFIGKEDILATWKRLGYDFGKP
jgi:thioredoxin 1